MRVSSEYLKSCVLLFLTSMAGRTSCVLLAYAIPWESLFGGMERWKGIVEWNGGIVE